MEDRECLQLNGKSIESDPLSDRILKETLNQPEIWPEIYTTLTDAILIQGLN